MTIDLIFGLTGFPLLYMGHNCIKSGSIIIGTIFSGFGCYNVALLITILRSMG